MVTKKYDMMQILIIISYIFLLFSMLYMPYELDENKQAVLGYKNIFNWVVCFLFIKWVRRPFGAEVNKGIDGSIFLIWLTLIISLIIKIMFFKGNGEQVLWFGIGFEIASVLILTILLYVEDAQYYTGRRFKDGI